MPQRSVGLPKDKEAQVKAVTIAATVLVLTITPSIHSIIMTWQDKPNTRPLLVAWYSFAAIVAVSAWRYVK
jgi:hypothetical protein